MLLSLTLLAGKLEVDDRDVKWGILANDFQGVLDCLRCLDSSGRESADYQVPQRLTGIWVVLNYEYCGIHLHPSAVLASPL